MPTLLTTRKMDPALAARVLASVRGRRMRDARRFGPGVVAVARAAALLFAVTLLVSLVIVRRQNHEALERARQDLLADAQARSATLTPLDMSLPARAEEWITRLARPYPGDEIAVELRAEGALASNLARPLVYVRGPLGTMGNAKTIALAAAVSSKDPLAACLVDPPKARTEKAMLTKVRAAYARDALFETTTVNVTRLDDAETGLPVLGDAFRVRVAAAEELTELTRLRRELDRAPTALAVRAAKSEMLLVAMDEEGVGRAVTELDGERPHKVRVALVDLRANRLLFRLQRDVDPKWISDAVRPAYAGGLDGCGLAMDIREATLRAR